MRVMRYNHSNADTSHPPRNTSATSTLSRSLAGPKGKMQPAAARPNHPPLNTNFSSTPWGIHLKNKADHEYNT